VYVGPEAFGSSNDDRMSGSGADMHRLWNVDGRMKQIRGQALGKRVAALKNEWKEVELDIGCSEDLCFFLKCPKIGSRLAFWTSWFHKKGEGRADG
jgi:hypothetical protein